MFALLFSWMRFTSLAHPVRQASREQQSSLRAPMFAVVACLEVDSMFATVSRSSKHRLHPITLSRCSNVDIDNFLSKYYAAHKETLGDKRNASLVLFAHATGGNFALLANVWESPLSRFPYDYGRDKCWKRYDSCIFEVVARTLLCTERKYWMLEGELIGRVLSAVKICYENIVHYDRAYENIVHYDRACIMVLLCNTGIQRAQLH
ncbi:Hypothetical protein, putative [Bodo saltans]|uniref:GPI-anchored surface protein n=1 Tax=Bodo saltans TaxID=75058 RepID=A0A0S4JL87_BODSA|nr:Hypothetical protein, putative [Bodo saltans]|eukprot:CUG90997.1 Hypothetical protein, putative [Bodo saltans]